MKLITGIDLRESTRHKSFIEIRKCTICGVGFGYHVAPEGMYLDTSCGCAKSSPLYKSWDEMANYLNRIDEYEHRKERALLFGLNITNETSDNKRER